MNPTFDPAHSDLKPNEAFWLQLNDDVGVAACVADRLFRTDDFVDELETGRLWYARPGEADRPKLLPDVPTLKEAGIEEFPVKGGGGWSRPPPRRSPCGAPWQTARQSRCLTRQAAAACLTQA